MGIKSFVTYSRPRPLLQSFMLRRSELAREPIIDELAREPNHFNILKVHQKINKKGWKIYTWHTTFNPFLQYYYKIFL